MLNTVTIIGRLTRDPELRRTGSGIAVASFTVAVERDFGSREDWKKETDFVDCVAWRQTGEFISKYFSKGTMIVVTGRLQTRSWTDMEEVKRKATEVNVSQAYFGERKRDSGQKQDVYPAPGNGLDDYGFLNDFDPEMPFH